ncbi:hypothetical protein GCM10022225_72910 [Plantactinospora mayteni]|uniref:Resolvase HTH domain-containing protein n=1 Tax=Plantactinospora mayteni TaxID=566021 RepID=A0ABQ4F1E9_9ACTN|nr:hypothetical protein Pma05_73180 [Plantactinospora mayteni]
MQCLQPQTGQVQLPTVKTSRFPTTIVHTHTHHAPPRTTASQDPRKLPRDWRSCGGRTVARCLSGWGEPKSALAKEFGISRETVYGYLRAVPAPAS